MGKVKPRLVNAVEFLPGRKGGECSHDPIRKILIEGIITAEQSDVMLLDQVLALEEGHTTPDREFFGLLAESDDAAIVVAEHQDRPCADSAIEHALDTDVEIAAIDQRQDGLHRVLLMRG